MRNHKKGQYFSFDAIVASVIFILTFISLITYWFSVKSSLESKNDEITREAARISDYLLTPSVLAISYEDKRVNISALSHIPGSEEQLRKEYNSPYDMYLEAYNASSGSVPFLTRGVKPANDSRDVAKVRRIFTLYVNSTYEMPAAIDVYLYR